MRKIKRWWSAFVADWRAETPRVWRAVRNVCATTLVVLPTATGLAGAIPETQGLVSPVFWKAVFVVMFVCGLVTGYAGKKKVSVNKQKRRPYVK